LVVSWDSHKPSGVSKKDTPDGFSELDCEAVWAIACEEERFDPELLLGRMSCLLIGYREQGRI
jgi:hypothetical protein